MHEIKQYFICNLLKSISAYDDNAQEVEVECSYAQEIYRTGHES